MRGALCECVANGEGEAEVPIARVLSRMAAAVTLGTSEGTVACTERGLQNLLCGALGAVHTYDPHITHMTRKSHL